MKKAMLAWLLITFFSLLLLNGCGKSMPPPDLNQFGTIAIARFATVEETADMEMRVPLDLGEKLKLRFKDSNIKWIYDQSDTLNPFEKKLNVNNISPNELFVDPKLAARIGKDLGADIVIIGLLEKPRLKTIDSDKQYTRPGTASMAGSKIYTLLRQKASIKVKLQIIDTKSGELIWNDEVKGATKYIKAFQTQVPDKSPVSEEVVVAQLRDHLVARMAHALFSEDFEDPGYPELKIKPDIELMDASGKVQYK